MSSWVAAGHVGLSAAAVTVGLGLIAGLAPAIALSRKRSIDVIRVRV